MVPEPVYPQCYPDRQLDMLPEADNKTEGVRYLTIELIESYYNSQIVTEEML